MITKKYNLMVFCFAFLSQAFGFAMNDCVILKDLPDDSLIIKQCNIQTCQKIFSNRQVTVNHLTLALSSYPPECLDNTLFFSGCSLFNLKHSLEAHAFTINPLIKKKDFYYPLIALLSKSKNRKTKEHYLMKLDILLRYGFHIPPDIPAKKLQTHFNFGVSESDCEDPRLFGAFYHATERFKRSCKPLLLLRMRKNNLIASLPKDLLNLLIQEISDPSRLLQGHCTDAKKIHEKGVYEEKMNDFIIDKRNGFVEGWPASITVNEIEKKIGPKVRENYDRLLKEWKSIHTALANDSYL